uniref:Uncharacterized protein n=1 Tax=Opuntia streptacantha TaxID=393608 RepID=A0A7C8ZLT7_OPUST
MALCLSTAVCGAHDLTTRPLSLVLSKKPVGRIKCKSGSGARCNHLALSSLGGARITHKNLIPLLSNPTAISLVCSIENNPMLPKAKYTTLPLGCESSQLRHSCLCPPPSLPPS